MKANMIIRKMYVNLATEFDFIIRTKSEEELKKMTNYEFEDLIKEYFRNNMVNYLKDYYNENDIDDKTKQEVFCLLYNQYPHTKFFDENFSIVPNTFDNHELFNKIINDDNMELASNILSVSEKSNEICKKSIETEEFDKQEMTKIFNLISFYSKEKKINLDTYNSLFSYISSKDKYGYYLLHFLNRHCKIVTPKNIKDLLNNIQTYGNDNINLNDCSISKSKAYSLLLSRPNIQIIDNNYEEIDIENIEDFSKMKKLV